MRLLEALIVIIRLDIFWGCFVVEIVAVRSDIVLGVCRHRVIPLLVFVMVTRGRGIHRDGEGVHDAAVVSLPHHLQQNIPANNHAN